MAQCIVPNAPSRLTLQHRRVAAHLQVSLVEIVNEQVQDLLRCFTPALGGGRLVVPGGGSGRTDVREVGGRVTLEGAAMVEAPTLQALAEAVDWGISVRATGSHRSGRGNGLLAAALTPSRFAAIDATALAGTHTLLRRLNEQSSRSHAILLLTLEQRVKPSAVRQVGSSLAIITCIACIALVLVPSFMR